VWLLLTPISRKTDTGKCSGHFKLRLGFSFDAALAVLASAFCSDFAVNDFSAACVVALSIALLTSSSRTRRWRETTCFA
jgi:hypothetical protein